MSDTTLSAPDVDRPYPPVAWLTSLALGFVVVGGIIMASYAPRQAPLKLATALLVAALVLMATAVVTLARIRQFAWKRFAVIFKWALLAYAIESAMIEFAFVKDHMHGASLVIVTLMLAVFATSVPVTIAFTTARYADLEDD